MSAVTVAELVAKFSGETSSFDKANASVQSGLKRTAIGAEETAESLLHLAASTSIVGAAYESASVQGSVFTRVALDASKAASVATTGFEEIAKSGSAAEQALAIVVAGSRTATAEFGVLGASATAMRTEIGAARSEIQGLGRSLGSTAPVGYATRLDMTTLALEAVGIKANATTAEILGMNAAMASGRGIRLPSSGGGASQVATGTLGRVESVGKGLAKVGLPLLAIGAAAVVVDTKFQAATARIEAFAGASHDEVGRLTPQFMALGEATGTMGKDVADGFFHIRSAIQDTRTATDVLTVSARASAAGLGNMEEVSNVITSARYSFGKTATEIGDIAAKAAVLSHADPSAFFKNMGQAIPIASTLKIKLNDVAGLVAIMTREGIDPAKGFQRVTAMMESLTAPTPKQKNVAKMLGIDWQAFRQEMQQNIGAALEEVYSKSQGNLERIKQFFGGRKAGDAALAFFNPNAVEENIKVLHEMANAAGTVDHAFSVASKTTQFQLKQTQVAIDNAAISLGTALSPAAMAAAGDVKYFADGFSHLNPGLQEFLVVGGGVVAVTGFIASKAVAAISAISAMRTAATALSVAEAAQTAAATATAGATAAEGVAAAGAAGGVGLLNLALLPEIALLGAVAAAGYGLYRAYKALNPSIEDQTRAAQESANADYANAQSKSTHASRVALLYKQVEILGAKHDLTARQASVLHGALDQLATLEPGLIAGFTDQGHAVGVLGGQYATLAAQAAAAAEEMRKAANAKNFTQNVIPARDANQKARDDWEKFRSEGFIINKTNRGLVEGVTHDRSSAMYRAEEARLHAEAANAGLGLKRALATQTDLDDRSKGYTKHDYDLANPFGMRLADPRQIASFRQLQAANASRTPLEPIRPGQIGGGFDYSDPGPVASGKAKKGRAPKESQEDKEADQLLQSLKDRVQNLSTSYLLLGKDADSASLKQEILGGEFASAAQKAQALQSVLNDLRGRGTLDVAAKDLFGKSATFDSLGGTAKLKAEAYAIQLVTDKRKAEVQTAKEQAEAVKSVNETANRASREALAAAATSDEDRLSILAYGVPFSKIPSAIGKSGKAVQAAIAQQSKAIKDQLAAEYSHDGNPFENGAKESAEYVAKRTKAILEATQKASDELASIVRANREKQGEGDAAPSLAARRAQYVKEQVAGLVSVGNPILDAARYAQVADAAGKAFDATPLRAYRDAVRSISQEMAGLATQNDAARIAAIRFDSDGTERMSESQARSVLAMQKALDRMRAMHEQAAQAGDAVGRAFGDGLGIAMQSGVKKGLAGMLQSLNSAVQQAVIDNAAKKVGAWATRLFDPAKPKKAQGDEKGNPGGWVGAAMGIIGKGGKDAALSANTKALNALTLSLTGGTGNLLSTLTGAADGGLGGSGLDLLGGLGSGELPFALPHFATGGHVEKGQKGIWQENRDGSGGEGFVSDQSGNILPRYLMEAAKRGMEAGTGKDASDSTQNNGGEVHHHMHFNPTVHITGPVDRRTVDQKLGAMGRDMQTAMERMK